MKTEAQRQAQALSALAKANEIRSRRAALKRDLKAGRVALEEVLANPPAYLVSMKIVDLLLATPKLRLAKANRLLVRSQISAIRPVGRLTDRQRQRLLAVMGNSRTAREQKARA